MSDTKRTPEAEKAPPVSPTASARARELAEEGAKASEQVAEAAVQAARTATEQSQENLNAGVQLLLQAQAPLAEVGYEQGRRFAAASARIADLYREAAERSADDTHALVAAFSSLGRGLQQWQHACFDLMSRSLERAAGRREALFRCRSAVELAEAQRDLYLDGIDTLFTSSVTLLELSSRIAQDAVRPLQERTRIAGRAP
jgi:hypothetical protein